jgi:hypothetical protein
MRLDIDPVLGSEQFESEIGQRSRPFPVQGISQDAARFLLHRAPVLGGADSETRFQIICKISDRDACHQGGLPIALLSSKKNDGVAIGLPQAQTRPETSL